MSGGLGKRVCIVGAGSSGLVATKCFVEEGYDVTTFERNDHVGGLWHYTTDPTQTTALPGTKVNVSKQGMPFSDFPMPDSVREIHPSAKEIETYLDSYAEHFDIKRRIRFSTEVLGLRRATDKDQWLVTTKARGKADSAQETYAFDRVLVSTGGHTKPSWPNLKGRDDFKGKLIHAQAFKEPHKYAGKTVVLVGISTTASDSIEFLRQAGAKKIYMSHRRSIKVMPRTFRGKAVDHGLTRRVAGILETMRLISPGLFGFMLGKLMVSMQKSAWPKLLEHPAFTTRNMPQPLSSIPNVSDNLPINLMEGHVESVQGIDHFSGPNSITLTDGTVLHDIDAVICATGTSFDISALLQPEDDPTNAKLAPELFHKIRTSKYYSEGRPATWLYRNLLSIQHPHSLAFLGHLIYKGAWFTIAERMSIALAQLWEGNYPMPSQIEMERNATKHFQWLITELNKGFISHAGFSQELDHDKWFNAVGGTDLYERTGWGWKGWQFWWNDRPLYKLVMDGPDTPFALRLFVTKRGRKSWPGARGAIEKANREVDELVEKWKREQEVLKKKEKNT
ncbi:hypothetical protein PRZ48_002084 [Zasmidium cellare]|uniref:Flavin-containing monooxygenase n=1 Tax=Zasmidium cellare TaxID=395010 RepID=A0ABR0F4T0_ZASCE|nr:hypothetical protein PRZ48_002084 [Zasmidium cellare]